MRPSASSSPSAVPGRRGGSGGLHPGDARAARRARPAPRAPRRAAWPRPERRAAGARAPCRRRPAAAAAAPGSAPPAGSRSSFSSPFSSSVTPQYGLPKRKPSQPPGLTSSRISSSRARPTPRRVIPTRSHGLQRVLLGQRQRRPASGRCRSRTPRRRDLPSPSVSASSGSLPSASSSPSVSPSPSPSSMLGTGSSPSARPSPSVSTAVGIGAVPRARRASLIAVAVAVAPPSRGTRSRCGPVAVAVVQPRDLADLRSAMRIARPSPPTSDVAATAAMIDRDHEQHAHVLGGGLTSLLAHDALDGTAAAALCREAQVSTFGGP